MKPDPEKGVKCYVNAQSLGEWNQYEGKDPGLFLFRMVYVIIYDNFLIIWVRRIQTEITLSTPEAEYISISQEMRDVLPFVNLIN